MKIGLWFQGDSRSFHTGSVLEELRIKVISDGVGYVHTIKALNLTNTLMNHLKLNKYGNNKSWDTSTNYEPSGILILRTRALVLMNKTLFAFFHF